MRHGTLRQLEVLKQLFVMGVTRALRKNYS